MVRFLRTIKRAFPTLLDQGDTVHVPSLPQAAYDGPEASCASAVLDRWVPHFGSSHPDLADGQERLLDSDSLSWISSLLVHLVVMVTVGLLAAPRPPAPEQTTLVMPLFEEREPEIVELDVDIALTEEMMEQVGTASLGTVDVAAPPPPGETIQMPVPSEIIAATTDFSGMQVTLQELASNDKAGFVDDLVGIQGALVNAHGDTGSVDRITAEILSRLESGDLLVAWLMDASESLRPRRAQIIEHFTRVYDELGELSEDHGDMLLTSVAAFGENLNVVTPEPTADREAIQAAVRDIVGDNSGVENVFSSVAATAKAYAKYVRAGRHVMMIVVTDECGDDVANLDAALEMLKRHRMTVHVIGPVSPFARDEVTVQWTDPETNDKYNLPVDAGPETAYFEQAALAVWDSGPGLGVLSSGFGPYGLTRLTHENGGMYLLHDDGRIPGPSYDLDHLLIYRPDYVSDAQYKKLADEHPLRLAVLQTAQATNQFLGDPLPRKLLAAGIQFEIKPTKKKLAAVADVLDRGLSVLNGVEAARKEETAPRWLAHYDLLKGRLLANKVRCYSYAQLLEEMYDEPKAPKDGTKNAWHATSRPDAKAAEGELPPAEHKDATMARTLLEGVVEEHSDTPWATIAKDELQFALCFHWQEVFMEPPEGVALPWDKKPWSELTEPEKKAKAAFDKKKAARKKRKETKKPAPKRSPPKL